MQFLLQPLSKRLPLIFQKVNYTLLSDPVRLGEGRLPEEVKFFPCFLFAGHRCRGKILLRNLKGSWKMAEPVTEPDTGAPSCSLLHFCPPSRSVGGEWSGEEGPGDLGAQLL